MAFWKSLAGVKHELQKKVTRYCCFVAFTDLKIDYFAGKSNCSVNICETRLKN